MWIKSVMFFAFQEKYSSSCECIKRSLRLFGWFHSCEYLLQQLNGFKLNENAAAEEQTDAAGDKTSVRLF